MSGEHHAAPSVGLPAARARSEVRVGLVLYGGVSLAIYIYGVVFEFWRLVCASQGRSTNAYTALLAKANLSATVDVISGASAGGINGVLLAKALASGGDLSAVRSLWVDGAGIEKLLQPSSDPSPPSFLRSPYFDDMLRRGLGEMDRLGTNAGLTSVLDLFVPGTRVRAALREYRDDFGQTLQTKQFRKVFHLKYRRRGYNPERPELGYDQDDFGPAQNETLVEVARATSAFPAAFEPKRIAKEARNERLFEAGDPELAWFSDGGILHNRPFTEAISTIFTRAADRPVRRWLLSVEPDPEHYTPAPLDAPEPEVIEVVSKAVLGIPRYESIIGDLERLQEHRHRVARIRDLLARVDQLATAQSVGIVGLNEARFEQYLNSQALYHAWLELRGTEALNALVGWIDDAAALAPESAALVEDVVRDTLNGPLPLEADIMFELRRISYLLGLVDHLLADMSDEDVPDDQQSRLRALYQQLWGEFDRTADRIWQVFSGADSPLAGLIQDLRAAGPATIRSVLAPVIPAIVAALGAAVASAREEVGSIADELDGTGLSAPGGLSFRLVFERFRFWDMFVLPVETLVGPQRDPIRFARISPAIATYIQKPVADKVAGDALAHFGGFLKRDWRRNDILWGRLDAAETIVRLLFEEKALQTELLEPDIRAVQEEIVREELAGKIPPAGQPWDYKSFLENDWNVGAETLADIPMQDRATLVVRGSEVLRNMFRRVNKFGPRLLQKPFGWIGRVLGFVLMIVRWPVIAIWGRDQAARRFASLAILFVGAWSLATTLLVVVFGVFQSTTRLWILIGGGFAVFGLWSILLSVGHRLRRR